MVVEGCEFLSDAILPSLAQNIEKVASAEM